MHISSPARPEELPDPSLLWSMGALEIALDAARDGWDDTDPGVTESGHALTEYGLQLRDPGGGWWGLARVEGGRYLFLGQERHTDVDLCPGPPLDVLEDAPDWLPWAWVAEIDRPDENVFDCAYWWDGESWARADYPDEVSEDGIAMLLESTRSVQCQVRHFAEWVDMFAPGVTVETGGPIREERGTLDLAEGERAFLPLVEAVAEHRVPAEDLTALLGPEVAAWLDVDVFRDALERTGLLAGGPEGIVLSAGLGDRTQYWGPGVIDGGDWHRMVHLAMQEHGELERADEEVPETEEFRDLLGRVSALAAELGGTAVCAARRYGQLATYELYDGEGRLLEDGRGLPMQFDDRARHLLSELSRAEAHPERGSWVYLRLRVTPDGVDTERAYDHVPGWPELEGWLGRMPSVANLRGEMAGRSPGWRPAWSWLLDGKVLHDPPADLLARARGELVSGG